MILFIEGPRACGKTYLTEDFMKSCNNPNVEYYKFYFANHIRDLNLKPLEGTPALHYFSLGNIMTIMEMNLRPEYKDKIWVFDRAIVSAYSWACLLKRLTPQRAREEFEALVNSPLYYNCKTLMIYPAVERTGIDSDRKKDHFGGIFSTDEELHQMNHFLEFGQDAMNDESKFNETLTVVNHFDQASTDHFIDNCNILLGIRPE